MFRTFRSRLLWSVWPPFLGMAQEMIKPKKIIPVADESGARWGDVRLSRCLPDVAGNLQRVRPFTLRAGMAVSGLLGLILAQTVSRPLQRMAQAIAEAPLKGLAVTLPESRSPEARPLPRILNPPDSLQDQRIQLEEARRLLVSSIIHEFGRLIGALQAALHALQAGAAEDPYLREELLQGMSQVARELTRLLEDLAHADPHTFEPLSLRPQPLNLGSWLRVRIPIWAGMARERGLRWEEKIPLALPVIAADPDRLAQALDNLVDNAVKFTPPGGCVRVEAGSGDGKVWIRVQDTGPGIPPEELPRLFEPFYRGRQGGRPGLGLGLFLARTIAEAHGGRLEVASEPGVGSAFTLILPPTHPSEGGSRG